MQTERAIRGNGPRVRHAARHDGHRRCGQQLTGVVHRTRRIDTERRARLGRTGEIHVALCRQRQISGRRQRSFAVDAVRRDRQVAVRLELAVDVLRQIAIRANRKHLFGSEAATVVQIPGGMHIEPTRRVHAAGVVQVVPCFQGERTVHGEVAAQRSCHRRL